MGSLTAGTGHSSFFPHHRLEKDAAPTPTPAVSDRLLPNTYSCLTTAHLLKNAHSKPNHEQNGSVTARGGVSPHFFRHTDSKCRTDRGACTIDRIPMNLFF